jgi:hypothetical protein
MDYYIQILIVVILAGAILYYNRPGTDYSESFQAPQKGYRPGHARRHPDQDLVNIAINGRRNRENFSSVHPDAETIAKLKRTILTNDMRTSALQVAANDVAAYKPGEIRPFNESGFLLSQAQSQSGIELNNQYDNSYYELWVSDENKEKEVVKKRMEQILKNKSMCIDYKHVNQCMSTCGATEGCTGFYIDSPNKCCMLTDPPYATDRHNYVNIPNNIDNMAHRSINKLIQRAEETDGKIVFNYIRRDNDNMTFEVPMDRAQCKKLCPKCIVGRCPKDYRCTNMMADPRYNYSCMITNEDTYDEKKGNTFDGPEIPYLDDKYGLNEYAGYDTENTIPITELPQSYKKQLDDTIVLSEKEIQSMIKKFDLNHPGPGLRGHGKKIEGFDQWINTDGYHPEIKSEDYDFIGVRGGNDPVNLQAYAPYKSDKYNGILGTPALPQPGYTRINKHNKFTANMIEKFTSGYSNEDEQNNSGVSPSCVNKSVPFDINQMNESPGPLPPKNVVYRKYMERQQCN